MSVKEYETKSSVISASQGDCEKKTYSVQEIAVILQISRSKAYELCKDSTNFKVLKLGRIVRISKSSFDEWLDRNL